MAAPGSERRWRSTLDLPSSRSRGAVLSLSARSTCRGLASGRLEPRSPLCSTDAAIAVLAAFCALACSGAGASRIRPRGRDRRRCFSSLAPHLFGPQRRRGVRRRGEAARVRRSRPRLRALRSPPAPLWLPSVCSSAFTVVAIRGACSRSSRALRRRRLPARRSPPSRASTTSPPSRHALRSHWPRCSRPTCRPAALPFVASVLGAIGVVLGSRGRGPARRCRRWPAAIVVTGTLARHRHASCGRGWCRRSCSPPSRQAFSGCARATWV